MFFLYIVWVVIWSVVQSENLRSHKRVKLRYLEMHWHSIGKVGARPGREGGHSSPPLHLHGFGLLPVLLQQVAPAMALGNQPGQHQQGVEVFNSDSSSGLSHGHKIAFNR